MSPVKRNAFPLWALHHGAAAEKTDRHGNAMRRISKYLFRLFLLLAMGFAAYAIFADLPAPTSETVVKLPLPQGNK